MGACDAQGRAGGKQRSTCEEGARAYRSPGTGQGPWTRNCPHAACQMQLHGVTRQPKPSALAFQAGSSLAAALLGLGKGGRRQGEGAHEQQEGAGWHSEVQTDWLQGCAEGVLLVRVPGV